MLAYMAKTQEFKSQFFLILNKKIIYLLMHTTRVVKIVYEIMEKFGNANAYATSLDN